MAPMCKSRYPVQFVAVDVKSSTRTIVDQTFSVRKCLRLASMSAKSIAFLCKMFAAIPERTKDELEPILGKKLMRYASGTFVILKDRSRKDQQQRIIMQETIMTQSRSID